MNIMSLFKFFLAFLIALFFAHGVLAQEETTVVYSESQKVVCVPTFRTGEGMERGNKICCPGSFTGLTYVNDVLVTGECCIKRDRNATNTATLAASTETSTGGTGATGMMTIVRPTSTAAEPKRTDASLVRRSGPMEMCGKDAFSVDIAAPNYVARLSLAVSGVDPIRYDAPQASEAPREHLSWWTVCVFLLVTVLGFF